MRRERLWLRRLQRRSRPRLAAYASLGLANLGFGEMAVVSEADYSAILFSSSMVQDFPSAAR